MNNEAHIHEVMKMMIASGKSYSRASLKTEIEQVFGVETRFHSCSMQGMDADQAIKFMEVRGKFLPSEAGFSMPADRMCNH